MTSHVPALVVGAGLSGLVCAYALRKAGVETQILESREHPGGVIRSEQREGFLLELGPQSFSGTPALLQICRELGLEKELIEAPAKAPRFVLIDGKLQQVPLSPPAFFKSSLFSASTKWSVIRDLFGWSKPPEQEESIAAFVRRKFSAELLEKLVGPFVSGIYAGDPEMLSLQASFPQVYEAEKSSGSVIRGMKRAAKSSSTPKSRPTLLSFREGNETLIRALSANLGISLRTGVEVLKIQNFDAGSSSQGQRFAAEIREKGVQDRIVADRLIVAIPTDAAARIFDGLAPDPISALREVTYASLAVVSLGYQKTSVANSLDGFGFLVPRSAGLRILGSVWNTSLFPERAPKDHALLTCFIGGVTDPAAASFSNEELVAIAHRELTPLLGLRQEPVFSSVYCYKQAIPQYNLGHSTRVDALENRNFVSANLWFAGNYLHGPSVGACVDQALKVAQEAAK